MLTARRCRPALVEAAALFLGSISALPTAARGDVIFGDIAGNTGVNGYNVGPGGGVNTAIAEGFTVSQTATLQSVEITLSYYTPGTGSKLALSIFSNSNSGNAPGTDLYDLSTNVTGSVDSTQVTATFPASYVLQKDTTYWLELYATNPSNQSGLSSVEWDGVQTSGNANVNPTGALATDVGQERNIGNSGFLAASTSDTRTAFQLNAVVPEPGTLGVVALAGMALLAHRRRA